MVQKAIKDISELREEIDLEAVGITLCPYLRGEKKRDAELAIGSTLSLNSSHLKPGRMEEVGEEGRDPGRRDEEEISQRRTPRRKFCRVL